MPQYQGVWTLQNQAQAQSQQQWVTDPNFKNTTLLLQADGTGSGSQNQTFLDSSTNNFFITRNGNTTQGSFTPFSAGAGYWGNYFNGTGSGPYIRFGSSATLTFGTGDFTIEFWVYFLSVNDGTVSYLYDLRDSNGTGSFFVQEPANTWTYRDGAGNLITTGMTSSTFTANQWYHVAVCRASGVINFYVNGIKVSSNPADTTNYATSYLSIMSRHLSDGANNNTNSYTSNFRVVKGTALYTSNFTPSTTPLTAVSGTSLLTCQANRFVDNSGNALTIAVDSSLSPSVQAFSPFAPQYQWTSDVIGGSGYFDGTGDYLYAGNNAAFTMGTGDFTYECWVYHTSISGQQTYFARTNGNFNGVYFYKDSSGYPGVYTTAQVATSSVALTANQWYHLVATRASGTLRIFINGVQTASVANSTNMTESVCYVGGDSNGTSLITGYISGARILKGTGYSSITVPTAPPTAITNTSLLLNFTNAGIYDGKMANVLETVGTAQVSTAAVKYGSGSMYFNGSTSYLIFKTTPIFAFGTGDFTIECWMYPTSLSSSTPSVLSGINAAGGYSWNINIYSDKITFYTLGATTTTFTTPVQTNVWQHFVITRANGYLRCFLNGVQIGSPVSLTSNFTSNVPLAIGANMDGGPSAYFTGYVDDFRITIGVARYTANFTPPQVALPRQ